MIKALKGNMIMLGLSDENIKRLRQDQPIKFNLRDLGLTDMDVLIFHGKTEEAMTEMMKEAGLIHPTKTIFKDSKNRDQ